jgi:hypothetical protein
MLDELNAWHLYRADRQEFLADDGRWLSVLDNNDDGRKVAKFTDAEAFASRVQIPGTRWVTPLQAAMIVIDALRPESAAPDEH